MAKVPTKRTNCAAATRKFKKEKQQLFLETLRDCGIVRYAYEAAQIDRTTAYKWRDEDPDFARAWADALEEATDALEKAARERAMGKSDMLMALLLKAHRPEKYGDKKEIELTGKEGRPIQIVRYLTEKRQQGELDVEALIENVFDLSRENGAVPTSADVSKG